MKVTQLGCGVGFCGVVTGIPGPIPFKVDTVKLIIVFMQLSASAFGLHIPWTFDFTWFRDLLRFFAFDWDLSYGWAILILAIFICHIFFLNVYVNLLWSDQLESKCCGSVLASSSVVAQLVGAQTNTSVDD